MAEDEIRTLLTQCSSTQDAVLERLARLTVVDRMYGIVLPGELRLDVSNAVFAAVVAPGNTVSKHALQCVLNLAELHGLTLEDPPVDMKLERFLPVIAATLAAGVLDKEGVFSCVRTLVLLTTEETAGVVEGCLPYAEQAVLLGRSRVEPSNVVPLAQLVRRLAMFSVLHVDAQRKLLLHLLTVTPSAGVVSAVAGYLQDQLEVDAVPGLEHFVAPLLACLDTECYPGPFWECVTAFSAMVHTPACANELGVHRPVLQRVAQKMRAEDCLCPYTEDLLAKLT